jgi:hypothetical protein
MFPYEPTTLDNGGDREQCPNAGNGPMTTGGAGRDMSGSTSLQLLGPVERAATVSNLPIAVWCRDADFIQPSNDISSLLQQTQAQLSAVLAQMAQPSDGSHRAFKPQNQAQACASPPSCGLLPVLVSFLGCLLVLGNGMALQILGDDILNPPAVSFADDIPRLNSMWDDTTPHWCGKSPLVVGGHPIPVLYWPELYKYGKKDQWKGTKGKWFEWKINSYLLVLSVPWTWDSRLLLSVTGRGHRKISGGSFVSQMATEWPSQPSPDNSESNEWPGIKRL